MEGIIVILAIARIDTLGAENILDKIFWRIRTILYFKMLGLFSDIREQVLNATIYINNMILHFKVLKRYNHARYANSFRRQVSTA